jgi:sugar transferase (PEP-CTERM/EpsH1 system associated)
LGFTQIEMKILWVSPFFLHPTDRGGQIRTLGILQQLHRRHEVHFAALDAPASPEGRERSTEYCTRAYPVPHQPPTRGSAAFYCQALAGIFSRVPLAVSRYYSPQLYQIVAGLIASGGFDAVVCDFLASAPNIPDWRDCVLFQHNVETTIWERHLEHAKTPLHRLYFQLQARRMFEYERSVCHKAAHVVAVSAVDADRMRERFQARVTDIPTGVDVDYFRPSGSTPPMSTPPIADLVFTGSMDWLPNIDGIQWFVQEVLPVIRSQRPACTVAIAGRRPTREVEELAARDAGVIVTGTVPDIRPYLWGSSVAIVPLRIGGGTRLKIYESMAAGIPIVSTAIGAEGLTYHDGEDILIADSPEDFAHACLRLMERDELRRRLAAAALNRVATQFSWEFVSRSFEEVLLAVRPVRAGR